MSFQVSNIQGGLLTSLRQNARPSTAQTDTYLHILCRCCGLGECSSACSMQLAPSLEQPFPSALPLTEEQTEKPNLKLGLCQLGQQGEA